SRVTFREMLTQTVRPSQRPVSGSRGGVNAQQVGLGSSVGSIDSRFTQGHLETTGLVNDLALQGDGFFVLSDGAGRYYTRSGAFGLDANNNFVDPGTGLHLQGLMADDNGVVQPGAYQDLFLDPGRTVPALASTSVRLFGNLNSDAEAQGTIMESSHFMAAAAGTDLLTALYGQSGGAMGLLENDQVSLTGLVSGASGSNTINLPAFEVGTDGTTLADLAAWIQTSLESLPDVGAGGAAVSIAADGSISLNNTTGATSLQNLQLTIPGRLDFNQSFRFSPSIGPGASGSTYDSVRGAGQIRAAATADDLLTSVYNSRGQSLGLNVSPTNPSTTLLIGGSVGEHQAPSNTMSVDAATTVADLLAGLQIALGISTTPVSLDADGRIVMSGEVGIENALGQVDIREVGEVNPTLETSFGFTETQEADDGSEFTASATVYDSLGDIHNVLFTFTKVIGRNEWNWVAEMEGDEVMVSGNTGTASFAETGEIIAFRYTDDAGGLSFRPQADGSTGALPITLQIDA
ncbi:flagellar hook-basal body complex protein, partial [bacterium]|nr:flagellar hook-basal body complex protein [bacterium]